MRGVGEVGGGRGLRRGAWGAQRWQAAFPCCMGGDGDGRCGGLAREERMDGGVGLRRTRCPSKVRQLLRRRRVRMSGACERKSAELKLYFDTVPARDSVCKVL